LDHALTVDGDGDSTLDAAAAQLLAAALAANLAKSPSAAPFNPMARKTHFADDSIDSANISSNDIIA
jgi:hypothetical protein